MTRRTLPLVLAVVGALIIIASVIAASMVRSSHVATVSLGERLDVPVIVTEPGMLSAVAPDVTVRATADDDEPVVLAIGRTSEVEAWLGNAEHARVTGLSSWEALTVEVVPGSIEEPTDDTSPEDLGVGTTPEPADDATPTAGTTQEDLGVGTTPEPADDAAPTAGTTEEDAPAPGSVPNPAGSDLWVVETVSTGSAELGWSDSPGRWSLVAATDGTGPAPVVELEWGREASTPWLVPGIIVGVLAVVVGVTFTVRNALARREQRRRDEEAARSESAGTVESAGTGESAGTEEPAGTGESVAAASVTDTDRGAGERISRRAIREMERAVARAERDGRAGLPAPSPIPTPQDVAASEDPPTGEPASAHDPLHDHEHDHDHEDDGEERR